MSARIEICELKLLLNSPTSHSSDLDISSITAAFWNLRLGV